MKARLPLLVCAALLALAPVFGARAPGGTAVPPADKAAVETGYWMTDASHIRHDAKCRWYKNSKGHFCGKDEGRAGKICGG